MGRGNPLADRWKEAPMNEMEAAQQVREGLLPSPHMFGNMALFALRVTGTGLSYRSGLDEFVWRSPDNYLNDTFLQRVNGVPVIWEHPEKGPLNSEEFQNRIIGTLMLPYIKEDEVWAIARIYDAVAIDAMNNEQLSTSPAVVFSQYDGNTTTTLDGGETLLIEGIPSLLCHLAICANGVWDKGGPPVGVSSVTAEDHVMAEKDAAEDRKDAAPNNDLMTKLDAIVSKLDGAHSRLDAMEADRRKDAEEREKEERERADRARKDASEAEEEKRQAAELEKLAAEEREEGEKDARKDGMRRRDGEDCMDHSKRVDALAKKHKYDRMGRRDSESEADHSRRVDAHFPRRDAETEEEREALKKANEAKEREEKARKDAEHRADAAERENKDLKARFADIESRVHEMSRETTAAERDELAQVQWRGDSVAALFGKRISGPTPGETALGYRRRVLRDFLPHSPQFKGANIDSADAPTLSLIENQVYADAQTASRAEASAMPGLLIPRVSTDAAGRTITKFDGDISAWLGAFQTEGARVKISRNPAAN
jgi:hypothetical protein